MGNGKISLIGREESPKRDMKILLPSAVHLKERLTLSQSVS